MSGLSNFAEATLLDLLRGTAPVFTGAVAVPAGLWVKLHVGPPGDAGTLNPATETARKQVHFAAHTGTDPTSIVSDGTTTNNGTALTWNPYSGPSFPAVDIVTHFSLWDASAGGNCLATGVLGGFTPFEALVAAATNLFTTVAPHGLAANAYLDISRYLDAASLASLGLTADTTYHVIASGLTTTAFKVSATEGGTELDIVADGAVIVQKLGGKHIENGDSVTIVSGQLTILAD